MTRLRSCSAAPSAVVVFGLALILLTAVRVSAQDDAPGPRTVAADLLVDAVRSSLERSVDSSASAPTPALQTEATAVAAAASAGPSLGARVGAARSGLAGFGRQMAFESGLIWSRTRAALGPEVDGMRRALLTPAGAGAVGGALLLFVLLRVYGPVGGPLRRSGEQQADAESDAEGADPDVAAVIVDARHLVQIGTPTNEVTARTGVSHDLVETMRRLQAEASQRIELETGAPR